MQPQTQETFEVRDTAPEKPEPGRLRVALVGGSGTGATDDLYRLLRRRLLALCIFLAGTITFIEIMASFGGPDPELTVVLTNREILFAKLRWLFLIAINLTSAWVLWRRPPKSLFGLRVIEAVVVGPLIGLMLFLGVEPYAYVPLEKAADEPLFVRQALIGRYMNAGCLLWLFVITAYGTIVPNTLKRAALVTSLIAASPVALFVGFATWVKPLDPEIKGQVVFGLTMTNLIAVGLVLFASSRIEVLRRQAAEARRLGQYVLKEKLGSGGMGEVFRAEHLLLRRPCALKTIRPEKAGDPETLRRFEREVQITATLTHPNTIQVFDYGNTEDGTFYYVMEYLPGLTLEDLVRDHGPLPPGRAVHFLRQVCAALAEAHARGLTHRDIKPGNVMVCERGGVYDVVKVLDFGLVRIPKDDAEGASLSRAGLIAGTPAYMSPEQAGGHLASDARSDIYSVGALSYFLLTGKSPFDGLSAVHMMAAHLYESPEPLPESVPPEIAEIVMRCLAKEPAQRWPDAASLEAKLAGVSVPAWSASEAAAWWARRKA